MAKMKISDLLFARNAPSAFHRPIIVISVIMCVIWSFVFLLDEEGDFIRPNLSEWLTYFIGLILAAFVAPTALGIYFFLPPLGENRKWEKRLLIVGPVVGAGWLALAILSDAADPGRTIAGTIDSVLGGWGAVWAVLTVFVIFPLTPILALKILVWLWQGVRGREK